MTLSSSSCLTQSNTPPNITIRPRNLVFSFERVLAKNWADGSPLVTACYNALSITFTAGEKFFIESVRHFIPQIEDKKLLDEVRGFCGQESLHLREHHKYNETLCRVRGYDPSKLEGRLEKRIAWAKRQFSPQRQLAATAGLEHVTAIFAHQFLTDMRWSINMENDIADFWKWHAAEEMEHKGVAFDVLKVVSQDENLRKRAFTIASINLLFHMLSGAIYMLHHDGQLWRWRTLHDAWCFLIGRKSLLRAIWKDYKSYYEASFHPWMHCDNRHLIFQSIEKLAAAEALTSRR